METAHEYEDRYVAFIDILGFSDHVEKSRTDPNVFYQLKHSLRGIKKSAASYRSNSSNPPPPVAPQAHAFSDSIVLSSAALTPLFLHTTSICAGLLYSGVLTRGGIAHGLLYHDDHVVFGPAMIEAYRLESSAARYPRILVTHDVFERSQGELCAFPDENGQLMPYRCCDFLNRDFDRLYHLHILWLAVGYPEHVFSPQPPDRARFIDGVRMQLSRLTNDKATVDIEAKLGWMVEYFNATMNWAKGRFPGVNASVLRFDEDEMSPAGYKKDRQEDPGGMPEA